MDIREIISLRARYYMPDIDVNCDYGNYCILIQDYFISFTIILI